MLTIDACGRENVAETLDSGRAAIGLPLPSLSSHLTSKLTHAEPMSRTIRVTRLVQSALVRGLLMAVCSISLLACDDTDSAQQADAGTESSNDASSAPDAASPDAFSPDAGVDARMPDPDPDAAIYQVSVVRDGDGLGTVSGAGLDFECAGDRCAAAATAGTVVTLAATPGEGSEVAAWSSPCAGSSSSCELVVSSDTEIRVTFQRTSPVTVTVLGPGGGLVSDDLGKIECPTLDCTGRYRPGTSVVLAATATAGPFHGWSGDCTGKGPCTLLADVPRAIRALFGHLVFLQSVPLTDSDLDFSDRVGDLVIGEGGDLFMVASNRDPADLGSFHLPHFDGAYVARIDGQTGALKWVRPFGSATPFSGKVFGMAAAIRDQHLYVALRAEGTVDLGGGPIDIGASGSVLLALDLEGEVEWSRVFTADAQHVRVHASALDVTADGRLFLGGATQGQSGVFSAWLVALDADGRTEWERTFPGNGLLAGIGALSSVPAA